MNRNYNFTELKTVKSKNGLLERKTIRLTKKKGNSQIPFNELQEFYDQLLDKFNYDPKKISISGMNNLQYMTIKSFNEEGLKDLGEDDYWVNRSKGLKNSPVLRNKLNNFEYIDFYVTK